MADANKKQGRISMEMKAWLNKQKPGAIMKPSTFEKIKQKAAATGAKSPAKVAGAAYWSAVKSKFKQRRKA